MAAATRTDYPPVPVRGLGETLCIELRIGRRLLGVAVTDLVPGAPVGRVHFFDPAEAARKPGGAGDPGAGRAGPALAAGARLSRYWIGDCQKMRYKADYRPLESWSTKAWRRVRPGEPIRAGDGRVGIRRPHRQT